MNSTERVAEAFARARAEGRRAALMPYLMGGFPDLAVSRAVGEAYAAAGADLVELGIPSTSIKVVTLGKEGAICDDQSKECQRLNRRVHLEMMKLDMSAAAPIPSGAGVATSFSTDSEPAEDQNLAEQDEASVLNTETETSSPTR